MLRASTEAATAVESRVLRMWWYSFDVVA